MLLYYDLYICDEFNLCINSFSSVYIIQNIVIEVILNHSFNQKY